MSQTSQGSFDAAKSHGNVRIKLLQYFGIDDARIVGAHVVARVRTVGIIVAHAAVGRIAVDHAVHVAR